MYKCPNCGGEIAFVPEDGIIKCEYCGSVFSVDQDLGKNRKSAEEHVDGECGKVFICSQCGASLYTTEETGVTFCSYCGSQAFLESRMNGSRNVLPDEIIPFRISKEKCEEIYRDKIKNAWFLPGKMKADTTIDKFRGIYMPCWIYTGKAHATGEYEGETVTRAGTYDYIRTYKIEADVDATYDGYVKDSSASFPDSIMQEISPFDMKNAEVYNDRYMAGFYADIGNVEPAAYHEDFKDLMAADIKTEISKDHNVSGKGVSAVELSNNTDIDANIIKVKKGFLPVWFLSDKNEQTGLMSYAIINGINGKIHADLPVDMKKYLLVSLLIAIPVFIILQFFTMSPKLLLVITMLLLSILLFVSTKMIRETYIQEHHLDDEGLRYYMRNKEPNGKELVDPQRYYQRNTTVTVSTGERIGKILIGVLGFILIPIIAVLIGFILNEDFIVFGFIIGIGLYFLLASRLFSSVKKKKIYEPGEKKIRTPFHVTLRAIIIPLIGILLGVIILVASPAHDLYYYLTAVLCCILLIITMLYFVRSNNRLALRKPAQLGKRGGDEDE